jgi:hypothetical protein
MLSLVLFPLAWQFSWAVPADVSFLWNKAAMHWVTIKETLCTWGIISERYRHTYYYSTVCGGTNQALAMTAATVEYTLLKFRQVTSE